MPTRIFTFFLVMLWFVPPLVTFFQLDSYTISTVCIILLFNIVYYAYNKTIIFSRFFLSILILTISFIFIHTIFTRLYFNVGYNLTRNLTSLLLLFIFLLGAFNLSRVLLQQEPSVIKKIFTRFFYFFIFIVLLSFVTRIVDNKYANPIFPYPEPSHLALFFGPVIGYLLMSCGNSKKRLFFVFTGIIIALLVQNMTLLVTMLILCIFIYNIYVFPILILGGLGLFYFSDLEYFTSRLDFANVEETNNLSSLVYLKGFQLMEEGLRISNGFGIGFQQLGYVPVRTEIGEFISNLMDGIELNSHDGGFSAVKIVAEFGIFGLVLIFAYAIYLVKQWMNFKKRSINKLSSNEALFFASIITVFSEFFFRGVGYFTTTMFLFITVLFLKKDLSRL